ncbi:IS3 family transposase, partial [Pseudoclavibacter chungangensis]|uniref:IS3 family transposase n=1 Tax=Pseudoclavibacter chungangensis TaxID=587635 RepID=UPI003B84A044
MPSPDPCSRPADSDPNYTPDCEEPVLLPELRRIHAENYSVYGVRKMHHAMRRAGWDVGQVAR